MDAPARQDNRWLDMGVPISSACPFAPLVSGDPLGVLSVSFASSQHRVVKRVIVATLREGTSDRHLRTHGPRGLGVWVHGTLLYHRIVRDCMIDACRGNNLS